MSVVATTSPPFPAAPKRNGVTVGEEGGGRGEGRSGASVRAEGQAQLLEGRIDRGRINGKSRIGHCQQGRRGREEGRDSEREGKEDS